MCVLLYNPTFFDDLEGLKWGHLDPNKGGGVFPHHQDSLRMSDFAFLASQKSSFSTGFIRFFDMAECHVVYSENLMLFDHFGSLFAVWTPESSKFNRFYKVFRHGGTPCGL